MRAGLARTVGGAALLAMALTCGRVLWESRAEHRAGVEAGEAGDAWTAAIHFERAVHWYLPGNPWSREGARALWAIAEERERAGDAATAVDVYRMLRSGLLSVRSTWQPMPDLLARSEDRIAALMAADPEGAWPDPSLPRAEREALLLANLREPRDPHPLWAAMVGVGFLTWVSGAVAFALRAWPDAGGFDRRAALRCGAVVVAGYALWMVGMVRA